MSAAIGCGLGASEALGALTSNADSVESRMGAAMALGVASRTGLLAAMLKDAEPHPAEHWAKAIRRPKRATREAIMALVEGQVVEQVEVAAGVACFHIPAARAPAVKEMGGIFEALLMHQRGLMDPVTTMNLVKFRCDKMLANHESRATTPTMDDRARHESRSPDDWGKVSAELPSDLQRQSRKDAPSESAWEHPGTVRLVNELLKFVEFKVEQGLGCTASER